MSSIYDRATTGCIFLLLSFIVTPFIYASDAETALSGLQEQNASVESISGSFRMYHRDFGMEQLESGEFWFKKPACMKWEYDRPEGQLFIADGEKSYFYSPQDNQVTIQPFDADDLRNTPLNFLLGYGDIKEKFIIGSEPESEAKIGGTYIVRLTPRESDPDYSYLILEIDKVHFNLRRLELHEYSGSTLEYLFFDLKTNVKINDKIFRFKIPDNTEELWMEREE